MAPTAAASWGWTRPDWLWRLHRCTAAPWRGVFAALSPRLVFFLPANIPDHLVRDAADEEGRPLETRYRPALASQHEATGRGWRSFWPAIRLTDLSSYLFPVGMIPRYSPRFLCFRFDLDRYRFRRASSVAPSQRDWHRHICSSHHVTRRFLRYDTTHLLSGLGVFFPKPFDWRLLSWFLTALSPVFPWTGDCSSRPFLTIVVEQQASHTLA